MSGSAHYLEPKFLSDVAYEVAALTLQSVSKEDLIEADLTEKKFVDEILKEPELSESIELAISDPVAQADRLEKEIDTLRREIRDFRQSTDRAFGEIADSFGLGLSALCYILAIVIVAWAFVYPEGNTTFIDKLQRAAFDWHVLVAILVTCSSLVFLALFMAKSPRVARKTELGESRLTRTQMEQRILKATAERDALNLKIPKIVRDEHLIPIARRVLERLIKPSYELLLQGEAAPLGEVWDPKYETETKPRKELERQLSLMSGGSIGISGSRGSGKTTLIKYFCRRSDGKSTSRKLPGLPRRHGTKRAILCYIF